MAISFAFDDIPDQIGRTDDSLHIQPLVPPGDDLATAARLWSVSEDLTYVSYLPSADRAKQL